MRRYILRSIGAVALIASAHSAAAQHPSADSTLSRLLREAVAANPALAAATARGHAADLRVRPAGALAGPTLSVGVMDLTLPTFAFRQSDFTEIDVQAEQSFPWPGTLAARTKSAAALGAASRADIEVARRDLVGRVAEVYHRLRYVVTARATLIRQQALLEGTVQSALSQYAAGAVPQSDPLQVRIVAARLSADSAALASEELVLRSRLRAMRAVRGADPIVITSLTDADALALLHGADSAHVGPTPDLARQPRIAANRAFATASNESVDVARLSGKPEFMVTARYGARPLGADFFSAFVGVRLPLWSQSKQRALVQAAHADADAAQSAVRDAEANLRSEWEALEANATASRDQLAILVDRVLPIADAATEASLRDYGLGKASVATVLAAEDAAFRVRLDIARITSEHLSHIVMLAQFATWEVTP